MENADRISDKMLVLMKDALNDPGAAQTYISSNDSIRIGIGLWTLAFYELQDAIGVMGKFLEHGTRNQILTMSYFNRTLEWEAFTGITARKAILQFASDPEMAAAFMPTYLSGVEVCQICAWRQQAGEYRRKRHTCRFLLTGCLEAGRRLWSTIAC